MSGVEAQVGMRVKDLRARNPALHQRLEPFPGHPTLLAPPPKRTVPLPDRLGPKAIQTVHVSGYGMIVEVAADNGPQPSPELVHWLVPASPKFLLELFQLRGESLRDGLALDDEPASLPSLSAHMGETQKIERLRFALASLFPVIGCEAPELNQARFVRVQIQPELSHAFPPFL
jgi:hypothetical protein